MLRVIAGDGAAVETRARTRAHVREALATAVITLPRRRARPQRLRQHDAGARQGARGNEIAPVNRFRAFRSWVTHDLSPLFPLRLPAKTAVKKMADAKPRRPLG